MIKELALFASAARTAQQTYEIVQTDHLSRHQQDDDTCKGAKLFLDLTAVTATGTLQLAIQNFDAVSNKWYTLLASSTISAVNSYDIEVYAGGPEVTNLSASVILAPKFRFLIAHGNSVAMTYSATGLLLFK